MKWLNTKLGLDLRRLITMANTIHEIHDNLLLLIKQATEHAEEARQRDEAIIAKSVALQGEVTNLEAQIESLGVKVDFSDINQAAGDLDRAVTRIGQQQPEEHPEAGLRAQSGSDSQTLDVQQAATVAGGPPPADITIVPVEGDGDGGDEDTHTDPPPPEHETI